MTRQVFTGAGRVGHRAGEPDVGFQISQRADFFEAEVGLETTLNRPIINTRDEPHADAAKHRRLHVITGDANLSETSTWLKVGTAAWVLRVVEAGTLGTDLRLAAPVGGDARGQPRPVLPGTARAGRRAPDDGGRDPARLPGPLPGAAHLARRPTTCPASGRAEAEALFAAWQETLDQLATDVTLLADRLDWVAKLALMESYRARDGLGWDAPKLAAIDLQYADVDPGRSLYAALAAQGPDPAPGHRRGDRARPDERRRRDTRAYFRGRVMELFGPSVVAASWDSVIFDLPDRPALQRVPLLDPLRGTAEQVGAMLDACDDVSDLFAALGR